LFKVFKRPKPWLTMLATRSSGSAETETNARIKHGSQDSGESRNGMRDHAQQKQKQEDNLRLWDHCGCPSG
jgi:hypothetical protein